MPTLHRFQLPELKVYIWLSTYQRCAKNIQEKEWIDIRNKYFTFARIYQLILCFYNKWHELKINGMILPSMGCFESNRMGLEKTEELNQAKLSMIEVFLISAVFCLLISFPELNPWTTQQDMPLVNKTTSGEYLPNMYCVSCKKNIQSISYQNDPSS